MKTNAICIFAVTLFFVLTGCGSKKVEMRVNEIQQLIESNLKPNDPPGKIVSFLEQNGFPYDFDAAADRYQSSDPGYPPESGVGIAIFILVNDDGSFKEAQVRKVYAD